MRRRRLILVSMKKVHVAASDVEAIAERVRAQAPDVDVVVARRHRKQQWPLLLRGFQPTLAVVFGALRMRPLLPGEILDCPLLGKHEEFARLEAADIPVPQWTLIAPDTRLDPAQWGPYVVVKPSIGAMGIDVRIRRTTRVRWEPPQAAARHLPAGPRIAQRFVYTGPWAVSHRVCTFLGRAQYCWRVEQSRDKRPLASRWAFGPATGGERGGVQIIAPSMVSSYSLDFDEELIALAERAHRLAFPDYPYLGFDLVRDAETKEAFVLEANTGGSVWHLSSKMGRSLQRAHGLDLYGQLGALDRAAESLVELVRRRARVAPLGRWSRPGAP